MAERTAALTAKFRHVARQCRDGLALLACLVTIVLLAELLR